MGPLLHRIGTSGCDGMGPSNAPKWDRTMHTIGTAMCTGLGPLNAPKWDQWVRRNGTACNKQLYLSVLIFFVFFKISFLNGDRETFSQFKRKAGAVD